MDTEDPSKLQELVDGEASLLYDLAEQISAHCVPAVNRNGCHAFCYRMKIILMAPM